MICPESDNFANASPPQRMDTRPPLCYNGASLIVGPE